jgi:AcrR family transcriptional regulator
VASTRDRLLDAALRAFATRGVDGTPITDLEEAAGLAPGSGGFYRYFGSKEEALLAAVDREVERVRTTSEERPPTTGGDPRLALAVDFNRMLTTMRTLGPLIGVLAREADRAPELGDHIVEALVEGGVTHDAERLAALMDTGAIPTHDPKALGAVVLSALVGYHLTTQYFGGAPAGVDQDRFLTTLVDLVAPAPS